MQVERPARTLTFAKISGLIALTTVGVALTVAVLAGVAIFAVLKIS